MAFMRMMGMVGVSRMVETKIVLKKKYQSISLNVIALIVRLITHRWQLLSIMKVSAKYHGSISQYHAVNLSFLSTLCRFYSKHHSSKVCGSRRYKMNIWRNGKLKM